MTRLTVEIDDFVDAARTMYYDIGEPVQQANARLTDVLAGCGSMAGDDEGGRDWAAAYDPAANSVVRATNRLAAAAFQTATLFERSARNYAEAEAASTTGGGTPLNARLPPEGLLGSASAPPSAAGGGGDEPFGWGLIKDVVGYVWPNGRQHRLRRAAEAFRHCATVLESVAIEPAVASIRFACDRLPEADDVNTVCGGMADRIRELVRAHRTLARSCDELADHIDHCHSETESALTELAIESGVIQTVGVVASLFSFGAAEVPTQVVQAGRIAAIAAKVGAIIRRFTAVARTLHAALPTLAHSAFTIAQSLDQLAEVRAQTANVTGVGRVDLALNPRRNAGVAARTSRETGATARLNEESSGPTRSAGRGRRVVRPRDRRHILDGDGDGSGGHRWPGGPNKTPFPREWSDDKILDNIADVVESPATQWHVQSGSGGLYTQRGLPAVWRAWEVRDGVRIRVAWEPATGRVRTAFPDDGPTTGDMVQ